MSPSYDNIYGTYDPIPWEMAVALWVDCEKPVKKYLSFADSKTSASRCIGKAASSSSLSSGEKRQYPYFLFGNLSLSDVADHCKIDEIVMTTLRLPPGEIETNFSDFHSRLEFGFELSWLSFRCDQCQEDLEYCVVGSNYSSVTCGNNYYSHTYTESSMSLRDYVLQVRWLEITGRRRNWNAFADHTSQIYFPSWIYDQFKEGKEIEMGEATDEERQVVRKMVITALWCIQMRPSDRPSMNKVVEMLEGNVEGLEMPPKPFLIPQEMPVEDP
ncbi:hypothetical protein Vadar_025560 [Vaccinium darrowii]|uniref:Uncharacterized protein n=1 Tax=Vaccinium darrowii TaxID=229202 RepID=A0ACB7Z6P8_9ERIC|nr:hypothetical protein Vadar_025560 [Vaccinium darrowii]